MAAGTWTDPRRGWVTFGDYAADWLEARPRPLAPKTRGLYDHLLANYIGPMFGAVPLIKITTPMVRTWLADSADRSEISLAKAYRLLSAIMRTATDDGLIGRNPCTIRGAGVERSAERPYVGPEMVLALADAIRPDLAALILLAGFGGLRRGELLGLRRGDVDVTQATVTVARQVIFTDGGERLETAPKTAAGLRVVHIPTFVAGALDAHMADCTGAEADAPVFTSSSGGAMWPKTLYREFNAARRRVGVPEVTLHDLRHTAGTLAAHTGATIRELQARLGHASPAAAMRYQHAAESRDRDIADALEVFGPAATPATTPIRSARRSRTSPFSGPSAPDG